MAPFVSDGYRIIACVQKKKDLMTGACPAIRLRKDQNLTIVQFADLHLGENDAQDHRTLALMRSILAAETPAFVVFSGDQVSGYAIPSDDRRRVLWSQAVEVAAESGVPFATLFGNHDDQPYRLDTLLWHRQALWLCLAALLLLLFFRRAHRATRMALAVSLPVLATVAWITRASRATRDMLLAHERALAPLLSYTHAPCVRLRADHASATLHFFDSGGGRIPEAMPFFVDPRAFHNEGAALAFVHIPPAPWRYDPALCDDGRHTERPSECAGSDVLMDTLVRMGVRGVFVGHDHGNAWCCRIDGMLRCYGAHTGFGGYDDADAPRGARVIEVHATDHTVTSRLVVVTV